MKMDIFQKKKYQALFARIAIALVAVSMGALLILWDTGIIEIPFLKRNDKKPAETLPETGVIQEETRMDWASFAKDAMDSLAAYSSLEKPEEKITKEDFNKDAMSLVKQKLNAGTYSLQAGVLVKEDSKGTVLFALPSLTQIPESESFTPTHFRDSQGRGLFEKKDSEGYFYLDLTTLTFSPADFTPSDAQQKIDLTLPAWYGAGDANTAIIGENGLFGYTGTYLDGKREKTFTVPATYPTAFAYREGFAVMADENGKVTIRNNRGEEVFTDLSLVLPDKTGEDLLGFSYFDGGILRVVMAGYDEAGNITSKRETVINTRGKEVPIPEGFYVRSLLNGVLTVSNGTHYGYLSSKGAWISSPVYQSAEPFFEGLAVVTNEDGKMGMIDTKGEEVLPCAFDIVSTVSDGHALCYSHSTGWYLLTKVVGQYNKGDLPQASTYYTKITITRGPQNTFDYEPDEIIELPPVLTTVSRTTRPENTLSQEKKPENTTKTN